MSLNIKNVVSAAQCRAARALLGWSQDDLEAASKVAKKTIADFERGARTPYARTIADLQRALEAAGVQFIAENGGGAGVRLAKRAQHPTFRVEPMKRGSGAKVVVTWPDGHVEHVSDFADEAEAERWIERDAPSWVGRHPRSKG